MRAFARPFPALERTTIRRGVTAGAAWGVTVAGALLGLSFYQYGGICLGQIIETTALAIVSGVLTIGPLAVHRAAASAAAR